MSKNIFIGLFSNALEILVLAFAVSPTPIALVPIAFLVTLGYERILTLSRKNERKFVGALFFILLLANVYTLFIRFSS